MAAYSFNLDCKAVYIESRGTMDKNHVVLVGNVSQEKVSSLHEIFSHIFGGLERSLDFSMENILEDF